MADHTVRLGDRRDLAHRIVENAPVGSVMKITKPLRTLPQNDLMWALLTLISTAMPMGRRHTPADWKCIIMNACGWECQFIEGLDGRPFPQGFRSSQLTKDQMTMLIEYMLAFCAEHNIAAGVDRDVA